MFKGPDSPNVRFDDQGEIIRGMQRIEFVRSFGKHERLVYGWHVPNQRESITERHNELRFITNLIPFNELGNFNIFGGIGLRNSMLESERIDYVSEKRIETIFAVRPYLSFEYEFELSNNIVFDLTLPISFRIITISNNLRGSLNNDYFRDNDYSISPALGVKYRFGHIPKASKGQTKEEDSPDLSRRNAFTIEFGGAGFIYALNYERAFHVRNDWGLVSSIGFMGFGGFGDYYFSLPIQSGMYVRNGRNRYDVGFIVSTVINRYHDYDVHFLAQLRYVYSFKNDRTDLGLALTPFISKAYRFGIQPWGSIRLGYRF